MLVLFFLTLIFLVQLLFITFAYGKLENFQKYIDLKFISILKTISISKLKKYSNRIYIVALNSLVSGIIISLNYLDDYPKTTSILFLLTILLYTFSISLKFNPDKETFEKHYLDDFIIALIVGTFFNFINELFSFYGKKENFNEWSLIYLIAFSILLVAHLKHYREEIEENGTL